MTADELIQHRAARRDYNMQEVRVIARQDRQLGKRYGISSSEYRALGDAQNWVCAICGMPETLLTKLGKPTFLSVDHNHDTNEIRGLLCNTCNVAISRIPWLIKHWDQINAYLGGKLGGNNHTIDLEDDSADNEE